MSTEPTLLRAEETPAGHRSGFVAIVGRPNAGKSTLLNQLLGQKLAIVTPKPQTTRRRMIGIRTLPHAQIVFVDTPGIHRPRDLINERMVERAQQSMQEADVVVWMIDANAGVETPEMDIARSLAAGKRAVVVVLNKIDAGPKARLLPLIERIAHLLPGSEPIPLSALTGENVDLLTGAIVQKLPEGPRYYPEDELTDETERTIVAELIREKVMLETRDEVPYAVAVTVDVFEEKPEKNLVVIKATIHVERESQKPIVIGRRGSRIREIGRLARADIETFLTVRVYLELFVRVQEDWTKHPGRLKEFGL